MIGRARHHNSADSMHCKDLAPADADELHRIAGKLFSDPRSEALGWQALFEALTGLRTNEALSLRMDARPDEPGGLTEDGRSLCVRRSKRVGKDNPYIEVHAGLKDLLAAHKAWHAGRYPESPWYFPGREKADGKAVGRGALSHALRRLYRGKAIPKRITSHGLRALYVLVCRSNGISDTQIAWEVNYVGAVGMLEKVYGGVPPHRTQGNGPKLRWLPKGEPAWKKIRPK